MATAASLGAAAGCSNGSNGAPASTSTQAPTTTARPDDGALLVGAVLPTVGSAAEIGVSMSAALALAAQEINEAGGVNGRNVRVVIREEGDNAATALLALQNLLQLGVDAIIGPTSSLNVLATLGTAVEAGVLTCAPTASALGLDAFPDGGLLIRTVPSDSLQALAIARVAETTGAGSAAVVYLDDAYGRPLGQAVEAALDLEGTTVATTVGFQDTEMAISAAVEAVVQADAEVVTVIADARTGPAMVAAIDAATGGRVTFVVNDAGRRPDAAVQPYGADLAARVLGVSPQAYSASTVFTNALHSVDAEASGLYAQNAYDCLNIMSLAAVAAGSNRPAEIAVQVPGVTVSGSTCNNFPSCAEALAARRNINYDGPSGNLAINADGEMTSAVFERFTFDDAGRDIPIGLLRIGDG
jgi:branched-chain amino acid transport system substrate-binding protein